MLSQQPTNDANPKRDYDRDYDPMQNVHYAFSTRF